MFSKIDTLDLNDNIYIIDANGNKLEYKIYDKYISKQDDTSYLENNNFIEITLITCSNSDNSKKFIIKAKAE